MRLWIIGLLLTGCSVDVNLKQKTPIEIKTRSEGEVRVTLAVDIATQVKEICGESVQFEQCSDKVIEIYASLIEIAKMINQIEGGK